jgi:hypothetical protein
MATIIDVSPTRSNTSIGSNWQDVSGRMLSLASSDDGKIVFAGSLSSGLWVSEDGGQSWTQLTWDQPAPDQFGVPGALGGCCIPSIAVGPESARWFVDRHPRVLADLTGDKKADIVGFGDTGVWTALSNGDGTFKPAQVVLADFCINAGGWHVDRHPRFVADITGDQKGDIVGFGDAGVYVALGNGDGTFQPVRFVIADFGFDQGWRVDTHVRVLADLRGNGRADIVGFGDDGVYVALSNGDGTFSFTPQAVLNDFGFNQGWRADTHVRVLADITGDGKADIVGFGDAGVYVALGNGDGTFQPVRFVIADFGLNSGWRVDKHVRLVADITGNKTAAIVGFGDSGVYVALSNGDGTFSFTPQPVLNDFAFDQGWRVEKHLRFLADITGDGKADIVGFGDAGVYVALSNGDGTFQPQRFVLADLGFDAGGWRVDKHPRVLADITGEGRADLVGFGDAGVYVALANADGAFPGPLRFVLPNFGIGLTVLALARNDREVEDAGVWRSTDGGANWSLVHTFPRPSGRLPAAGQLVWGPGSAHFVCAAGENSLAISRDGGATWQVATRQSGRIIVVRSPVAANHVAVATTLPGELRPPFVYALASNMIQVSFDGGDSWTVDGGDLPTPIGGTVGLFNSNNECVMVVSPRTPVEVYVTRDGSSGGYDPQLWRGDFSDFATTKKSTWEALPIPPVSDQDSGNVFLAVTRPGQGEALFFGPQRFFGNNIGEAWVAPLDPASPSDWRKLGTADHVHADLHGLFLSADFRASFDGHAYHASGTFWLLSDGGIDRSTNGGMSFEPAGSINSLSTVNFAGAAVLGQGPLLSLNTGDNDGFASRNGGQTWRSQQYGGGDNDTSWADPLRPHSMLIFTPRWDQSGGPANGKGQTLALYETAAGSLPDIVSSTHRQMIPGPPLHPGTVLWNASSGFAVRGYRPLVQNLSSEDPSVHTDAVFIRFFGNFFRDGQQIYNDHLAILLRARNLRGIKKRTDWNTPGGWQVDRHPRLVGDLTGDGKADIVGFGDAGVWTALSKGGGLFADPQFVLADLGFVAGGWRVDKHVRVLADLTGHGRADIVAFGDDGVYVALSNGDGTFAFAPVPVLNDFGYNQGWRVDKHVRMLADITGDGKADIVGFGDGGVYVALGNGDGTFQPVRFVIGDLGFDLGWRVEKHVRMLADLRGNKKADIVAFGDAGVYVALSNGDGTFSFTPEPVLNDLGFDQDWRVEKHPRFLADLTGNKRADIVAFGDAGVYVALSNGDGTFSFTPQPALNDFGYDQGWRVAKHPRWLADMTGEGRADIVGFGDAGVFVAVSNGDGTFSFSAQPVLDDFGFDQDWRVGSHLRFMADISGEGRSDIVGFGDAGVLVALGLADGTFRERPLFVIPNFGLRKSGPVEQVGPFLPDPTIAVVQASGGHTGTVFYVGGDANTGLWKWTEGMAAWQPVIPGRGATHAQRFFVSPYDPNLIYVIDGDRIKRSDDGGSSWQVDASLERMVGCNGRIPIGRDGASDTTQVVLSDMQFDPFNSSRRFAVGSAGAFLAADGVTWQRVLDTGAMRGLPTNCYFDRYSAPSDPSLYVGFAGRSIVKIGDLGLVDVILHPVIPAAETEPPAMERSVSRVRTADGRLGRAEIVPDGRLIVRFDDGDSRAVKATDVTVIEE